MPLALEEGGRALGGVDAPRADQGGLALLVSLGERGSTTARSLVVVGGVDLVGCVHAGDGFCAWGRGRRAAVPSPQFAGDFFCRCRSCAARRSYF